MMLPKVHQDPTLLRKLHKGEVAKSMLTLMLQDGNGLIKDMISTFDSRLSHVKEGASGMEAQVDDLGQRVEGLEAEDAAIHTAIKDMVVQLEESLRGKMTKIHKEFMGELTKMRQVHEKELNSTLACIEEMHMDLALCKRALAMGASTCDTVEAKRIEVPKLKSLRGIAQRS
ncbi:hypothetical protein ACLB2K_004582 [Fragaria x ananassa]